MLILKNNPWLVLGGLIVIIVIVLIIIGTVNPSVLSNLSARVSRSSQPGQFTLNTLTSKCVSGIPQVTATWSLSQNATAYDFKRKYPWPSAWEITGETDQLTFTDATWESGYTAGTYSYQVLATNGSKTTTSNTKTIYIGQCTIITPTPTPIPTPTPTPTPTTTPTSTPIKISWGAYVGNQLTDAANFEALIGKKMNLQSIFIGWGSSDGPFPSEYGPTVRDQGKTLVIFWEQYGATLDDIANGYYDNYISQFAAAAKAYNGPIILAPLHEMNGNWDPWDGTVGNNTPAKVIAAWQRIHNLFANAGNVKFAWDVNSDSVPDITANAINVYYPGDTYVDYVAVDGFNFNNPWQTWDQIFASAISQLKIYHKPIYILSMASAAGSSKATWITDALTVQIPKYPEIAGWVWFNQNKEQNWLINSDPNSLAAFKTALP